MKKRLSLLMVLMMVLSLVPMSVFATAGTAPGGIIKIDDTDEDQVKQVTVKLTQAAGTELTTGKKARLTLNKGEFYQTSNKLASATVTELTRTAEFDFGQEFGAPVVQSTVDGALNNQFELHTGRADTAFITIPEIKQAGVAVNNKLTKEIDILVTFYAYFDNESVGDITLTVEEMDNSGLDVAKPIVVGTVSEGKGGDMKLSVDDAAKRIGFDGGELSKFSLKDIDKNDKGLAKHIELELPDYLQWNTAAGKTTVTLGTSTPATSLNAEKNILTVFVPAGQDINRLDVTTIVDVKKRDASTGEVTLKATARKDVAGAPGSSLEKIDGVIGVIADYDVAMTAWEVGKKEIPAMYGGDETTVRVKLAGVVGSFTNGRDIDFTIKGADIVTSAVNGTNPITDGVSPKGGNVTVQDAKADDGIVEDGEFTLRIAKKDLKDFEFELKLKADWAQNGPVTLIADSRDFGKIEAEIAKVTPAYTVETKVTTIKKGESLATADIVIKEAKAGILDTDKYLVLNLNDRSRRTMTFGADYKIEATNGMKVEDGLYAEDGSTRKYLDTMAIEIKTSSSKEAATITISNVMVKVDGATVDGEKAINTYVVEKGDQASKNGNPVGPKVSNKATAVEYALSKDADLDPDYSVKYVNVVKEYGTIATTTVFKIGSKDYTVNGEAKTANEAPYIAGKGFTMLPVRAVGEALGLRADWNAATKTATFANDSKIASVVIGADTMFVNGTPFKLSAPAEIKNGSTFVELRSLAQAFGVKVEWDAATKSVTIQG